MHTQLHTESNFWDILCFFAVILYLDLNIFTLIKVHEVRQSVETPPPPSPHRRKLTTTHDHDRLPSGSELEPIPAVNGGEAGHAIPVSVGVSSYVSICDKPVVQSPQLIFGTTTHPGTGRTCKLNTKRLRPGTSYFEATVIITASPYHPYLQGPVHAIIQPSV